MGFRDFWALDPRSHSRLESLAGKEARAGGLLPHPDPEWSLMLLVVPEEVRTRYEGRMPILRLWNRGGRAPRPIQVRAVRREQDRPGNSDRCQH